MNWKPMLLITLILLLVSVSFLAPRVQRVNASGTIYIRANGSVEGTTDILTYDNITYTLIANISDEIVVERDDIVVDGAGYVVQGTGSGTGVYLLGRNSVTVKNIEIRAFERGIRVEDSSSNNISNNRVTDTEYGIVLYGSSSQNTLRHNDASNNTYNFGIFTVSVPGYVQDIDSSNTVNGKPVYYWINRQDMPVPLDAGYVVLVNCTGITVKNLNLINNMQGVALSFTTNSVIANNSVMSNFDGIRFDHSSNNNLITGNNITANSNYGIRLFYDPLENGSRPGGPSCNNTICGNNVTDNGTGIRLDYPSDNIIRANNVADNSDGIGLYGTSAGNTICENNVVNSVYGIWFHSSFGSRIYHNNFIDNTYTVYPGFDLNFWDVGYPAGGNYWSPIYHGVDIYSGVSQNETGSDGIGDMPFHLDNYPLAGMFNGFNVTYFTSPQYLPHVCNVAVISNSTISDFDVSFLLAHPEDRFIRFNVTGDIGSTGFCRIEFPTALLNGSYIVEVNMAEIPYTLLACSNSDYSYLYFTYVHSAEEMIHIIPEFPSFLILPLFMITALLAAMVCSRKRFHSL